MSFFKITSLPGTAWPAVPLPQFSSIWNAYQELERTQWLSPSEIEELQIKQINSLLKHCYDNTPYYRNILIQTGLSNRPIKNIQEFKRIPFLTRSLYQKHFNGIKANKFPPGMEMAANPIFTSGTNGVPIQVHKTNRDDLWWQAISMRDFQWNGMNPHKKLAAIRLIAMTPDDLPRAMKGIVSRSWLPPLGGFSMFESGLAFGLDIRQDPNKQIEWLMQIKPNYLISLPSNLDVLSSILIENKQTIPELELIQIIGEPLTPAIKERIEAAFKVPVHNLYSTNETGYIASSCPSGHGLHVHAENVFTEVLGTNDQPCKPGETGRLVMTSLTNFANPFIRYDIIDDVTLADGPCPCGRGLPLWKHVDGRRHPMLFLANNRRKVSTGIMLGIRQIGGIHQFQVIQHSIDSFTLRVVPNHEWTEGHGRKMIQCIQEEMEASVHVDIKESAVIERPNGKLKIIVVEPETNNAK